MYIIHELSGLLSDDVSKGVGTKCKNFDSEKLECNLS